MSERCDCGHLRMSHDGATPRNDGGNDCRKCDCPVFTPVETALSRIVDAGIAKADGGKWRLA